MKPLLGFIIIDPQEIALRIYQSVEKDNWHILFNQTYPIMVINAQLPDEIKLLETVANAFSEASDYGVGEWKICSRTIDPETSKNLSLAISIKVELLTIEREQNLIFQGLLKELVKG